VEPRRSTYLEDTIEECIQKNSVVPLHVCACPTHLPKRQVLGLPKREKPREQVKLQVELCAVSSTQVPNVPFGGGVAMATHGLPRKQ
jgi:hypothetical protein